jgi:hypothetical protein
MLAGRKTRDIRWQMFLSSCTCCRSKFLNDAVFASVYGGREAYYPRSNVVL